MAEVGHIVDDVLPQLIRQAPRAGLEVSITAENSAAFR